MKIIGAGVKKRKKKVEAPVITRTSGGRFLDELIKIADTLSECMIPDNINQELDIIGEKVNMIYDKTNFDFKTLINDNKIVINYNEGNQLTYYVKQHRINRDLDDTHKLLDDDEVKLLNNIYDSLKELIKNDSNSTYRGIKSYKGEKVSEVIKSEIKKTVNKDAYLAGLDGEISEVLGKVNDNEGWLA